jgi:hypothetical protein
MSAMLRGTDARVLAIGAAVVVLLDCFACDSAALPGKLVRRSGTGSIRGTASVGSVRHLFGISHYARTGSRY